MSVPSFGHAEQEKGGHPSPASARRHAHDALSLLGMPTTAAALRRGAIEARGWAGKAKSADLRKNPGKSTLNPFADLCALGRGADFMGFGGHLDLKDDAGLRRQGGQGQ